MKHVAVIQMCSNDSVAHNLQIAADLIKTAAKAGAKLVVLPENFAFMGINEQDKLVIQEPFGSGPIQTFLAEIAVQCHVWLIAGTIPLQSNTPDKIRAASLVINDQGQCVARYDKIHLFDVTVGTSESYAESATIEAGNELIVVDTPVGKVGLSVCYDLRFPELYRQLVDQGAELITVPSAFTYTTGMAHWEVLLRARAIENLCYVVAANQVGQHGPERKTYGHSMIVNPWGEVLADAQQDQHAAIAPIDLEETNRLRSQFPCLTHIVLG